MSQKKKLAVIQMCSGADAASNWQQAEKAMYEAAAAGCELVVLPENFAMFDASRYRAMAAELPAILDKLASLANRLQLWIVAGTLPALTRPDGSAVPNGRVRTRSHVIAASGDVVALYDKIHLFDVNVSDAQGRYRESETFEPGEQVVCVDTPVGRLGLTVCYDLRFPELFRALLAKGAELISVPAAFTYVTGEAHWQVLLRARAIENQVYILGAAQGGIHSPTRQTWGHSQIIDPWGRVLAERQESGAGIVIAERCVAEQQDLRTRMPIQEHRRVH